MNEKFFEQIWNKCPDNFKSIKKIVGQETSGHF